MFTEEGRISYQGIAGAACKLPIQTPEALVASGVAGTSGALVAGTPEGNPVVVLTDTGDPDCDGHRITMAQTDGTVVPEAADLLPEISVIPGTPLQVTLNKEGVAAFQEQAKCDLPQMDTYSATAITGIYGKAMLVAITGTKSDCDGRSFKLLPVHGWAYPLKS